MNDTTQSILDISNTERQKSIYDSCCEELEGLKSSAYFQGNYMLEDFKGLYLRYLKQRGKKIAWDKINPPPADRIVAYDDLTNVSDGENSFYAQKLAVLKLNGGLGTSMGCNGPKSAIEVREDMNFLDMVVAQVESLNRQYDVKVPLLLMNSFNTDKLTNQLIRKYKGIRTFTQSVYPRIHAESLLPVSSSFEKESVYPPGHGDLFISLERSGELDRLLDAGKEYLFVSNIDNLAATVDFKILKHFIESEKDFLMEVTEKTRADVKGGTLIEYENSLRLLEIAQVPASKKSEFTSVRKFKIFNTNSAWINLKALKKLLQGDVALDIIENRKTIKKSNKVVIQLETAIGAAIKLFEKSGGVIVPRSRFLPVKTTSDLFLIQSNLFIECNGALIINERRPFIGNPLIKLLGKNFTNVNSFQKAFKNIPDLLELDHLTVSGNVKFGKNVVLKGNVIIIADDGCAIDVPDGAILEDKILSGNLPILEH